MLEMRIEGLALCLCCALRLVPAPRLRKGLVVGSGLGHLASKARELGSEMADTLPEPVLAALRKNLHKGRSLAELAARHRLLSSQCERLVLPEVWSVRLLSEGGLRHLKPTPLQVWHVIQGRPQPQCHLVLMHVSLQLEHRIADALLSTQMFLKMASVLCWHLGHASSKSQGMLLMLALAKPLMM